MNSVFFLSNISTPYCPTYISSAQVNTFFFAYYDQAVEVLAYR